MVAISTYILLYMYLGVSSMKREICHLVHVYAACLLSMSKLGLQPSLVVCVYSLHWCWGCSNPLWISWLFKDFMNYWSRVLTMTMLEVHCQCYPTPCAPSSLLVTTSSLAITAAASPLTVLVIILQAWTKAKGEVICVVRMLATRCQDHDLNAAEVDSKELLKAVFSLLLAARWTLQQTTDTTSHPMIVFL